ncbi:MAG: response regulator [Candidatus Dadabacteria bacterium]|nr:MAG: response regulator [Candidatus Dadabacteria bacterium]
MAEATARILVVDDEESVRDILRDFLTFEGYVVALAADGREGIEAAFTEPFDLILTDLEMPEMSGLEFLAELQTLRNPPPTIMMTGYGTVESAIEAMKAGARDYILKPFQIEELAHLIERTLDHARLEADNARLQQLVSLYQVSERLNSATSRDEIADVLVQAAANEYGADAFCFWELDTGQWERVRVWPDPLPDHDFETFLNSFDSLELLRSFHEDQPLLLSGAGFDRYFHEANGRPAAGMIVPLRSHGRVTGMLAAFSFSRARTFTESERRTFQIYSDRAAVCLANVRLQQHLQQTFMQTIQGLVAALEAKDEYTRGHSERVAQWAQIIGELYGLSEQALDDLHRAALLHDIGKIGLNLDALNRPGKLTDEEIENFKLHTLIGKRILEPVEFLQGSLPAVTHHHERWDGNGYPLGLAGKEIPLGARVLAVADAFEVMITDRVYRKALTLQEARDELARSAGSHFDPAIVEVFLEWLDQFDSVDELPVKGGRRRDTVRPLHSAGADTTPENSSEQAGGAA